MNYKKPLYRVTIERLESGDRQPDAEQLRVVILDSQQTDMEAWFTNLTPRLQFDVVSRDFAIGVGASSRERIRR